MEMGGKKEEEEEAEEERKISRMKKEGAVVEKIT